MRMKALAIRCIDQHKGPNGGERFRVRDGVFHSPELAVYRAGDRSPAARRSEPTRSPSDGHRHSYWRHYWYSLSY